MSRPVITPDALDRAERAQSQAVQVLVARIKVAQRVRNATVYKLAKLSGLDQNTVGRFLSSDPDAPGRTRLASAVAIARALGLDVKLVEAP